MNTEYTRVDNNVVVRDDDGNNRVVPNQDNIEEILISENRIEELEKKKKEIEKDINKYMKKCDRTPLSRFFHNLLPIVVGVVAPLSAVPFCKYFGVSEDIISVIDRCKTFIMFFTTVPSIAMTVENILEYKYKDREERALNTQMQMLNEELNEEQEYLKELKKDNINTIKNNFETNIINHNNIKENIDTYCDLYYDCSYNLEDYYDYYLKHDKLPRNIQKSYTEEGQEIVKEYLEEKGPALVKTRNIKRK